MLYQNLLLPTYCKSSFTHFVIKLSHGELLNFYLGLNLFLPHPVSSPGFAGGNCQGLQVFQVPEEPAHQEEPRQDGDSAEGSPELRAGGNRDCCSGGDDNDNDGKGLFVN